MNVWGHSLDCLATFPEMFGDIPRNVWGHSPKCFGDILPNVWGHSLEYLPAFPGTSGTFPRMFGNILPNVWWHSLECLRTFPGIFGDIPRNITFSQFPAFPRSCIPGFSLILKNLLNHASQILRINWKSIKMSQVSHFC